MLDQVGATPDLDLLLSPGDTAELVAERAWTRRDGRAEPSQLWVVLHGRHGVWTHAYRVVRGVRPGHATVYLEAARPGDRRAELRAWCLSALPGPAPAPPAAPR
jgi:hypothetical protein